MTEGTASPAPAESVLAWQRLHPATLALAIARLGPRSLNLLPALIALGATGNRVFILPAVLLFLLGSLVFAWLGWLRFRFAVGGDAILIESGVLSRQHRTIPFDRIQDVAIEQGLIARALGIARVGFETGAGGGKENEADLDAIALDAAQALRTTIRAHHGATVEAGASASPVAEPEDRLLFAMGPRRLLVAGLFNFSLAALAVVGAAMQFFDDFLPFDFNIFNPADWADVAGRTGLDRWLVAHRGAAATGAAAALIFIGFATGIVTMFFANWNFRLTREPRALRRRRGLTTRTDVAVPVRRVQAAILVTGWFRRRFGWHELRLQSLASDGGKERDHQVVPFARLADIDAVLAEIAIARAPADADWRRSHGIVALGGLTGAAAVAIGGLTALAPGWTAGVQAAGWVALAAAVPIAIGAVAQARAHRWTLFDDQVAIRRGLWRPRTTLLPHASVQSADLKTDFIQRPLGLATLVFGVPGGSMLATHEIPAIPIETATALRAHILSARTQR